MFAQISETKKTIFLFVVSFILFIFTLYFFIDFSQSIEKGIKRFFNNISFQHNFSTYNETLEKNKKLHLLKKQEELKKVELSKLKRDKYFDFKIKRFEKNEF